MTIQDHDTQVPGARIKVIGIGGGGTNAVSTMIKSHIEGVEFIAANTDVQSLRASLAPRKIQVGKELTKGLGAGADPDIGRDAALEDRHELQESINGSDMVFITAGMGGGTGTGGAAVAAQIAKETGALTVGVVTKPFNFEGNKRRKHAESGIEKLREYVDTLIVIPNQQLLKIATPELTMVDAFKLADNVLVNAVRGISDIINIPGTVNVDFADVKTVMSCTGRALMGIGVSKGERRASEAASQAISSPLLEDVDIEGATGILITITANQNISLLEVNEACTIIQDAAHEDANIIFGAVIEEEMADELRVTVIATGFPSELERGKEVAAHQEVIPTSFQHQERNDAFFSTQHPTNNSQGQTSQLSQPTFGSDQIHMQPHKAPLSAEPSFENMLESNQDIEDLAFLTMGHVENNEQTKDQEQPQMTENVANIDADQTAPHPDFLEFKQEKNQNNEKQVEPKIHQDIDEKIDEALSYADKLASSKDDLEVPAFLRSKGADPQYL